MFKPNMFIYALKQSLNFSQFLTSDLNHVWKFDTCECHGPSLLILYQSTRTEGKSVYRGNWSITTKLYPHKQVNFWLPIKNIPLRIKNNFTA